MILKDDLDVRVSVSMPIFVYVDERITYTVNVFCVCLLVHLVMLYVCFSANGFSVPCVCVCVFTRPLTVGNH